MGDNAAEQVSEEQMTEEQAAEARGDNFEPTSEAAEGEVTEVADTKGEAAEGEAAEGEATESEAAEGEAAEGEAAEGEAAEATSKPVMLPKTRYDAMRGRMEQENQALREELEQARTQQPQQTQQQPQHSLDDLLGALDAETAKAMADGEHEKATEYMRQARVLERQAFQQALQQNASSTSTQSQQNVEYNLMLDQVEAVRPELNANSDKFDEGLNNEVIDLVEAFNARPNVTPKKALEKALAYVFPEGWNAAPTTTAQPRKTNIEKNIKTAQNQAPKMAAGENSDAAGKTSSKLDAMALSDEEFDKLTEKELQAMRGDDFG